MKKTRFGGLIGLALSAAMLFTGCAGAGASGGKDGKDIAVISREDGSGTRGAFVELFGVEQKNDAGEKIDRTLDSAVITNSTSVVITSVEQDSDAIGYISLGSLNDKVKAVKIDGGDASADNVKNGSYKISRPFNIAYSGELSEVAQDFVDFILSAAGQAVVEEAGYISKGDSGVWNGGQPEGKVVIGGSSSVTPVMEKLREAYLAQNPNAEIEVQQSDSSVGMQSAIEGVYDIGMASRELKDSELEAGLDPIVIALDGIAVIVHKDNPVNELSSEQVMNIYIGEITAWDEING